MLARHISFNQKIILLILLADRLLPLGIEDTVVVETSDVVYVAKVSHTEELKEAVKELEKNNVNQAFKSQTGQSSMGGI